MSNGLSITVILGLALLIVVGGALFLLLDDIDVQETTAKNGDHLRQVAVTSLASSINHYGNQQLTGAVGSDWTQLGSSQEECSLVTAHCQLEERPCLNLPATLNQDIKIPIDQEAEDGESGYAIRAISTDMVEIKACYTQSEQPIIQRVKVKSALTNQASSSGDISNLSEIE